ncbi:hypothetical protein PGT21_032483 [Puccinia graminis f. sp. tritici]|uniref:Uncharacterized protein n=1 Tax=Puccinia graminis f. sp. tritici TaxID=56615 RepID=A0A5B0NDR4_PUCGR|nr:hypothetical protein PGT21_032483 [Puccinia graminis f. sp. tritici]
MSRFGLDLLGRENPPPGYYSDSEHWRIQGVGQQPANLTRACYVHVTNFELGVRSRSEPWPSEHAQDPRIPLRTLGLRSERSLNPSRPSNDPGSWSDAPEPTGSSSDDPDRPPAPQSTPQSASVLPIAHQDLLKAPDAYRQAPRHQATPQSTQQPTGAPPSHPVTP